MYYDKDELELKIKRILNRCKVRYRSLNVSDERVIIGIEGSKSKYNSIIPKFRNLGLQYINAVYGRWIFKVK